MCCCMKTEYRVLVPLALNEYRKGQLFAVAEASKNETGGGEGVEVVKQEEFTSSMIKPGETISGIYTLKLYRIKSKSPWIVRKLLPDGAFILREDCWNAYPYCKTIVTNPEYMGDNFYIVIESTHIEDNGTTPNALNLSKNLLKHREVIMLDIYDEKYLKEGDTTPETNPRIFHSKITGRGPLTEDWAQTTQPVMCCYKVVQVLFKWRGLQGTIERLAHKQYPRLFTKFHRETFCWIDRWYDLTMDEIKELEDRTVQQLKQQMIDPQKRGICADDDELPSRQHSRRLSLTAAVARRRASSLINLLASDRQESVNSMQLRIEWLIYILTCLFTNIRVNERAYRVRFVHHKVLGEVEKTMDKVEGMLKPLKYDKNNTVLNNTATALSPNYESSNVKISSSNVGGSQSTQSDGIMTKRMSTYQDKDRRISKTTHYRSLSAPEFGESTSNVDYSALRKKIRDVIESIKTQDDRQEKLIPYQGPTAFSNLTGPIRVETSRKIWRQSNADVMIEDRVELIGCGSRNKEAKLIELIPTVHQYGAKGTRRIRPSSTQSVKVGDNYIVIERISTLKRLPLLYGEAKRFEEIRTFRKREWSQGKQLSKLDIKSESAVGRRRIFDLHGPLQVKSKQKISACRYGEYTIEECIEFRANGSSNEPQEELFPFKREVYHSPLSDTRTSPCKCDEHIRIGENVISVKRHIKVAPTEMPTENLFTLSDSRSYDSNKTTIDLSYASSNRKYQRNFSSPGSLSIDCATGKSPDDSTARSPTFMTAKSRRSFCVVSPGSEAQPCEQCLAMEPVYFKDSPPLLHGATRTARSPSGCSPPRRASPRVDPLTPERSPPRSRRKSQRQLRGVHRDSQTACSPGVNTSRNLAIQDKIHPSDSGRRKVNCGMTSTSSQLATIHDHANASTNTPLDCSSSKNVHNDLEEFDERSHREAKILRANAKPTTENLHTRQEEVAVEETDSLEKGAQYDKSEGRSTTIPASSKQKVLSQDEGNYHTARSLSAEVRPTAPISLEVAERGLSVESALHSLKTARQKDEILTTKGANKEAPFKQLFQLLRKKSACDSGLLKTARERAEIPSSDGSVGSMLLQSRRQTANGTGSSVRTAREKNSLVSLEPQLRLTTVKVRDEKELLTTARENDKSCDLSGRLRRLRSNASVHATRAKLADERGQLKTASESSDVSRMQESNRKLRLQSMNRELVDAQDLPMTERGNDRIFRKHEYGNRMLSKSRLQIASMKTDEQKLQKAARDNSGPRNISSDSPGRLTAKASIRMMKWEPVNGSELPKTAREQNEPGKLTPRKWIQKAARGRMMTEEGLLKTARERIRNFSSPSRGALDLNKQSGRSNSERDQTEGPLNTAREDTDKFSNKERVSKPLQVASPLLSKCVPYVMADLSGQRANNKVMREQGAHEYNIFTRDQRMDLEKKQRSSEHERHGRIEVENDDEKSEKLMHMDTARTLSFKTPPRYHRLTANETPVILSHQTAKHSTHLNSRVAKDDTRIGEISKGKTLTTRDQPSSPRNRTSSKQSSWRFRTARIERSSCVTTPTSIAKISHDEDTKTSSERTRSSSPRCANGRNGSSQELRSTQNTSKSIGKRTISSSSKTPNSSRSKPMSSTASLTTSSTTRHNSNIVTVPSMKSPSSGSMLKRATEKKLNDASAIVIESTAVHNLTIMLKINIRLMANGTVVDAKTHGLRTKRVIIGEHEVYNINSHR